MLFLLKYKSNYRTIATSEISDGGSIKISLFYLAKTKNPVALRNFILYSE